MLMMFIAMQCKATKADLLNSNNAVIKVATVYGTVRFNRKKN